MGYRETLAKSKLRRKLRIRKKITGTEVRPRLAVKRSLNNIYAQLINDVTGTTIVSASTIDTEVKGLLKPEFTKIEESKLIGKVIAERALKNNIKNAVFDRGGYIYHGRIKAVADAAREAGLQF